MLMVNPKKRISAHGALEHPWLLFWEQREAAEGAQAPLPTPQAANSAAKASKPNAHHIHAHSAHSRSSSPALPEAGGKAADQQPPVDSMQPGQGRSEAGDTAPSLQQQHQQQLEPASREGEGACTSSAGRGAVNNMVRAAMGKLKLSGSRNSLREGEVEVDSKGR